MFIGEVIEAEILSDDEVMTYSYYHSVKKGTTPKNAPSYNEETVKKGYRCSICGYVLNSDERKNKWVQKILYPLVTLLNK